MKRIFIFFTILVSGFANSAIAQDINSLNINSKITKVTVFLSGAQVTREGEVTIEKGTNHLVFDGVSPQINPQSIQLSGTSGVNLLSVVHRVNYLSGEQEPARISNIKDSIERADFLIDQLHNNKFVLEEELQLILANRKVGGDKGTDVAQLEDMQELYRRRLPAIKEELLKLKLEETKFAKRKQKLVDQLNDLTANYSSGRHEVMATIKSDIRKTLKLQLSYFTGGASWYSSYDVRCKDLVSSIQLIYKANITQNSEEDWKNVALKISAGNPDMSGTRPILLPSYLSFYDPSQGFGYEADDNNSNRGKVNLATPQIMNSLSNSISNDNSLSANSSIGMLTNAALNVEFNISIPYTILSNGKEITVDAQVFEMPANYTLSASPKLDKSAFLLARVSGKEELNQLNGMANIYVEGTYVGQSQIVTDENDSLNISLGRDKGMIIERKKVKEMSSKSFLGSNKKESSVWEISIRNTKNIPVSILVEDQVPVSNDKDIEVEVDEKSEGNLEEATGKISWQLNIPAGETKKIKLAYTVKYPKNKRINSY